MSAVAFLADVSAAGPLPENTTWIGLLALGCFAILMAADKAISIWSKLKKPKPDHEVYATKDELDAAEERLMSHIEEIKTNVHSGFGQIDVRMTQMERTLGNLVNDMARSLGRLEGQLAARMPVTPVVVTAPGEPAAPTPN